MQRKTEYPAIDSGTRSLPVGPFETVPAPDGFPSMRVGAAIPNAMR
jgi:hypothetical protein